MPPDRRPRLVDDQRPAPPNDQPSGPAANDRRPRPPDGPPRPANDQRAGPSDHRLVGAPDDRTALRDRLDRATARLDPPFAVVDLARFDANARALAASAGGKPVRLASKSVRCRELISRALATPGWRGVMAYTLAEALWLAGSGACDDVLVAYPTAERAALATLTRDDGLAAAVTVMVDDPAQLDLIDAIAAPGRRPTVRICLDLDASWRVLGGLLHVGVRRSPVHSTTEAGRLAAAVAARRGFRLVGLMAYEAQVAGLGDTHPAEGVAGGPARPARPFPAKRLAVAVRGAAVRAMKRRSLRELFERRAASVAAVRAHADLEFVNGGGTGSVAATAADPSVTEVTAGSGLFGPATFDAFRTWRPTPAALFALSVVRRPAAGIVTVSGGGWIASGAPGRDRLPLPWLPPGLRLLNAEGAGEVQTPLAGGAAKALTVGDRVWFRHAKAGELCEHVNELYLVTGDELVGRTPTYRGEGHAFLG